MTCIEDSNIMKEIIRLQWTYILYEQNDRFLLSVVCGTVGIFETNIWLNETETEKYRKSGKEFIDGLAEQIRNAPSNYTDRHVDVSGL